MFAEELPASSPPIFHGSLLASVVTRVQPTVTKLGIPFDSKVANRIMTEEKGVATSFLYQLKTVLDSLHKDLHGSKSTGKFANTLVRDFVPMMLLLACTFQS